MKLPLSWLREWVEVEAAAEDIATALTHRGFYVEGIESHGRSYPRVVVGRVLEVMRHPNADRLTLCRVDSGAGEVRVVCGAPNVRAGMVVPLATVGATLPGGTVIRKSTIRGEESQGMLCSARELELSDDHEGILDLAAYLDGGAEAAVGKPLDDVIGPPETVLEVEIPFNRPDALGVVGLGREVRAALGGRWTERAGPRLARPQGEDAGGGARRKEEFDLELEDQEGCPRYIAQALEGVAVGPSPRWLTRRLESVGQRAINNVVDITNFVLFELGQPLHAFDLDRLSGPAIRVRRARAGEKLTTLDGKRRELNGEILVIADRDRPVAVAGVMGGADTEVSVSSTRLLLECAWFDPRRVRRGARALGLATEASKRFERGVDPGIGRAAVKRFLELLGQVCPRMTLGPGRERVVAAPGPPRIELRSSRCRRLIGLPVSTAEAAEHLERFEFGVQPGDPLRVTVPSWRVDVTIEDDLVEEVARSIGYDMIPEAALETGGAYATRSAREILVGRARRAMVARGLTEAWTSSMVSEREARETARLLGQDDGRLVRLQNPMSRESEVLRLNPLPGLLRACAHNLRQGIGAVRLFEIGPGFSWPAEREAATSSRPAGARAARAELPVEAPMVAAVLAGPRYAHAHDASQQPVDFDDAKGIWEGWLEEMRVDSPIWRPYSANGWKPGASAEVATATSRIGWAGALSQALLRSWEIEAPVYAMVALLDPLQDAVAGPAVSLPGRFPPVRRDLAFFVPETATHLELERVLAAAAGEWLGSIELFDVYAGPGTPTGMKSMAYALQFQNPERTLTEAEVQAIQDRMVSAVVKSCGGRLRER